MSFPPGDDIGFMFEKLPDLAQKLGVAFNCAILCYLLVYASARPSPQLLAAVAFELALFAAVLLCRRWRARTCGAKAASEALHSLESNHRWIYALRRCSAGVTVALSGVCFAYFLLDFSALCIARSGCLSPPAFSLELLAGAFVDDKKFERAEPIELAIVDLRKGLYGERSELVAAAFADLGDLYRRWHRLPESASYYERSIVLTKQLQVSQGWGSPATRLGTVYWATGRRQEAERVFDDAIAIRTKVFGAESPKVRETLMYKESMLRENGRITEADQITTRIASINSKHPKSQAQSFEMIPVLVLAFSLMFLSQRDRLIVMAANSQKSRGDAWHLPVSLSEKSHQ
jgi:tetratricopeptide (TPR) repeat protein